jgi:hypothetical protein
MRRDRRERPRCGGCELDNVAPRKMAARASHRDSCQDPVAPKAITRLKDRLCGFGFEHEVALVVGACGCAVQFVADQGVESVPGGG